MALRDTARLEEEIARLTSLNNLITTVGGVQAWLFEDMVAETLGLLRDLADTVHSSPEAASQLLLQRFNNPEVSNAIVYHLRMLASSWLKGNAAIYQDFIQSDLGVEGYCKEWLDAPNQEIDHLGIMLLIDVLLKPVGFAVEILYLDRSPGSQVNSHMFQDEQDGVPTNPGSPIIHLLYRPSHYDILYKDQATSLPLQEQVGDIVRNTDIQVNRATNFKHQITQGTTATLHDFSNIDMNSLLDIPGFCPAPVTSHHGFPAHYTSLELTYSGPQISTSLSPVSPTASPGEIPNLPVSAGFQPQQSTALMSPTLPTQHSPQNAFPPSNTQIPIHSHVSRLHPISPALPTHVAPPSHPPDPSSPSSASSFRPSKYEWEAAAEWQEGPVVFQTSTFKNSHYNTAHYNNPNFQPEEWSPESDDGEGGRSRKKST